MRVNKEAKQLAVYLTKCTINNGYPQSYTNLSMDHIRLTLTLLLIKHIPVTLEYSATLLNENSIENSTYIEFAAFQTAHRKGTEPHGEIRVNYNFLPFHLLYLQHRVHEKVLLFL